MIRTTPRHRSFKRLANRTPNPDTPTEPEGVGNIAPPRRPPVVDPPNPDSATQKKAIIQNKQNGRTSRTTTKRRPSHQFRRNLLYMSNTKMQCRVEFRGSRTQTSLPAPMYFPLIQCPYHTDLEKAPSPNYAINSLAICPTPTVKFPRLTSFHQANLPWKC